MCVSECVWFGRRAKQNNGGGNGRSSHSCAGAVHLPYSRTRSGRCKARAETRSELAFMKCFAIYCSIVAYTVRIPDCDTLSPTTTTGREPEPEPDVPDDRDRWRCGRDRTGRYRLRLCTASCASSATTSTRIRSGAVPLSRHFIHSLMTLASFISDFSALQVQLPNHTGPPEEPRA